MRPPLPAWTGLVNWYDISFDNEGYFDGRPSMFVSMADRTDPIEVWGTRIGRILGLLLALGLMVWLVLFLTRGS